MIAAATTGQGAIRHKLSEKFAASPVAEVAVLPTIVGPTEPPRLPIMLMKPMAEAAAVDPRKIVGIGQNAGKWQYMKVPTQHSTSIITTGRLE